MKCDFPAISQLLNCSNSFAKLFLDALKIMHGTLNKLGTFCTHTFTVLTTQITHTDDIPKYLKLAVNIQHEMLKNSKLCWLSKIQNIYNSAGLSCKFSSAGTESTKQHVNKVMMRLSDQFIQDWFNQIYKPEGKKGSNKLRTYKLFKDNFQPKYYLTAVATVRYRIALTRIRVSCHRLAIETGRYQKPTSLPISQRLCTLCNQVEDEIHLICVCKRNAHLRIDFFSFVQNLYPPFQFMLPKEKVIYIMQNKDYVVINNFAAFIYRSLLHLASYKGPLEGLPSSVHALHASLLFAHSCDSDLSLNLWALLNFSSGSVLWAASVISHATCPISPLMWSTLPLDL